MIFVRTERFKRAFNSLPKEIQQKTIKALRLLAEDPFYPSLVVKKIQGASGIWEARIDLKYRMTFQLEEKDGQTAYVLRNVDDHDACMKNPQLN
jgi:mRNA-degrading endonuclease RelE of RelBE toxin-antitoxin system